MTRSESGAEILKTDKRGRVRTTPERRCELLEQYDQSGLSGPKFAAVTGLKYQTLASWLQRRRMEGEKVSPAVSPARPPAAQWLETVLEQAQTTQALTSSALIVRLPSGATLELANLSQASLAGALLRAWEKASC
jgi:hypothetical protein